MTGGPDPLSSLYVLAVLTSVLFAFTKYLDDTHRDAIEEKKGEVCKLVFPAENDRTYITDVRNRWAQARDKKPLRACNPAYLLYVLILVCLPLYVCIHIDPTFYGYGPKYDTIFAVLGIVLTVVAIWVCATFIFMRKEKHAYGAELYDLQTIAEALTENDASDTRKRKARRKN